MKKQGRPKTNNGEKRDNIITVKMSDREVGSLTELCNYFDCDRSSMLRALITHVHDDILIKEVYESNGKIGKIGKTEA